MGKGAIFCPVNIVTADFELVGRSTRDVFNVCLGCQRFDFVFLFFQILFRSGEFWGKCDLGQIDFTAGEIRLALLIILPRATSVVLGANVLSLRPQLMTTFRGFLPGLGEPGPYLKKNWRGGLRTEVWDLDSTKFEYHHGTPRGLGKSLRFRSSKCLSWLWEFPSWLSGVQPNICLPRAGNLVIDEPNSS